MAILKLLVIGRPSTSNGAVALNFIKRALSTDGWAPSIREIAAVLGCSPPQALNVLRDLEADGLIERGPGKARAIRLVDLRPSPPSRTALRAAA